jgi:hypothetical protein
MIIFKYTLQITENTVVFSFQTIRIYESHYAVTLFRSCQKLLLYHTIHFSLMHTTKMQSCSK